MVEALGIEPDERFDRGERKGPAGERSMVRYVSPLPRTADAHDQVLALFEKVRPATAQLKALPATPGAEVTVSVGLFINEPQWQAQEDIVLVRGLGIGLEPEDVATIEAMGAAFDVDIYVNYDYEDEEADTDPDEE
jgi:hypothetical protein